MKVVFRGDNWEEVEGAEVFLPRPVRKEVLRRLLEVAKIVYAPPSTISRLSKKILREFKGKIKPLSLRGRFARHDPEVVAQVISLRRAGLSIRKIAQEVGLPKSTVHYILTRMRKMAVEDEKIILG